MSKKPVKQTKAEYKEESAVDDSDFEDVTAIGETMLRAEYISGDLRDAMLSYIRNLQKPWQQLTQSEQETLAMQVNQTSEYVVKEVVRVVASEGRRVINAQLEQITVKDGIKAVAKIDQHDENRHTLLDACGGRILIVLADPAPFLCAESEPAIDPDQHELIDE